MTIDWHTIWHYIVTFLTEHKLLTTLLLVLIFLPVKKFILRRIKRLSRRKGEDRRHQINTLQQLANALFIVLLMLFWASEIQSLAISIAAFMVAIVFATREVIQCFIGFIYYLGARPFRVGDWVQMNNIVGEVVEMDWAKTALLEVEPESLSYTGKHVYVPNSQLVSQTVKNLNFMRRYRLHTFTIVNEPTVNAFSLLDEFTEQALAHCAHFKDVAERYKGLIERHLDVEFIQIQPEIEVKTNPYAKIVVTVSMFCPTAEAYALQQKICADWMALWFKALEEQTTQTSSQVTVGGSPH